MRLRGGSCYIRRRCLQHWRPIHATPTAPFSTGGGGGGGSDARSRSDSAKETSPKYRLPPPTWSVSDLQLSVDHEPVSDEVLVALCRRACVRVPPTTKATTTNDSANGNKEEDEEISMKQMAQDVGNLLHMLRQVQSIDPKLATTLLDSKGEEERARLLYDVPRGVSPIVFDDDYDDDNDGRSETNSAQQVDGYGEDANAASSAHHHEDSMEIERVRESLLRPKMVQVGGHSYFAVRTGRPRTLAEDDVNTKGIRR